jgi:putative heme iron utilization protein
MLNKVSVIDVGYTDYEIEKNLQRIQLKLQEDNQSFESLLEKYIEYAKSSNEQGKNYYPFDYWALRELDMYLYMPRMANSYEEEMENVKLFELIWDGLDAETKKIIKDEFRKYRDKQHAEKGFIMPFYACVILLAYFLMDFELLNNNIFGDNQWKKH